MGAGIAVAALDAGLPVTMIERDAEAIARGAGQCGKGYDALVAKGRMTKRPGRRAGALHGSTRYDDLPTPIW
jgi:3-hydroxyacyl-CoA dehydrogenase